MSENAELPLSGSEQSSPPRVQRRANFRATLTTDCGVQVQIWRILPHTVLRDRPLPSQLIKVDVVELSQGGMGLSLAPCFAQAGGLELEQRLRVVVRMDEHEALLDGRVRHLRRSADGTIRAGVQFQKLDNTIEGRQARSKLDLILGRLSQLLVRSAGLKKSA